MLKKIEEIQKDSKLNKDKFAQSINLSKQTYNKLMTKTRNIQIEDIQAICVKYNINCNWLLLNAGIKEAMDNNLNNELCNLVKFANYYFKNASFVENLILDKIINILIEKTAGDRNMFYKDNRPHFMLLEILKNVDGVSQEHPKNYLIQKIKESKDPFIKTNKELLYKIENLTEDECFYMLKYSKEFVATLSSKFDIVDKLLFMPK